MDQDTRRGAEPQAHFFAFDGKQARFAWGEHPNFATASDAEFFETVHILFFAAQIHDHALGFGSQILNRNCIGVARDGHGDEGYQCENLPGRGLESKVDIEAYLN